MCRSTTQSSCYSYYYHEYQYLYPIYSLPGTLNYRLGRNRPSWSRVEICGSTAPTWYYSVCLSLGCPVLFLQVENLNASWPAGEHPCRGAHWDHTCTLYWRSYAIQTPQYYEEYTNSKSFDSSDCHLFFGLCPRRSYPSISLCKWTFSSNSLIWSRPKTNFCSFALDLG